MGFYVQNVNDLETKTKEELIKRGKLLINHDSSLPEVQDFMMNYIIYDDKASKFILDDKKINNNNETTKNTNYRFLWLVDDCYPEFDNSIQPMYFELDFGVYNSSLEIRADLGEWMKVIISCAKQVDYKYQATKNMLKYMPNAANILFYSDYRNKDITIYEGIYGFDDYDDYEADPNRLVFRQIADKFHLLEGNILLDKNENIFSSKVLYKCRELIETSFVSRDEVNKNGTNILGKSLLAMLGNILGKSLLKGFDIAMGDYFKEYKKIL